MKEIKATEKTEKQREIDEKVKTQPSGKTKLHPFLLFILIIVIAIVAFPFVAPDKFDDIAYAVFKNSSEPTFTPANYKYTKTNEELEEFLSSRALPEEPSQDEFDAVEEKTEIIETIMRKEPSTPVAREETPKQETIENKQPAKTTDDNIKSEIKELKASNEALSERITALEKMLAYSSFDSKRRALTVIAAMELQKAIRNGKNFEKELDRLYTLSSKEIKDKLDTLRPYVNEIKSDYALSRDFKSAMNKALSIPKQNDSGSFWTKVENVFRSLVVIRKTTDTDNDTQSKLNKAEKLVNEYLFTEALTELKNLPSETKIVFTPWEEEIKNKENAKQIINEVLNDSLVNFSVFNSDRPEEERE